MTAISVKLLYESSWQDVNSNDVVSSFVEAARRSRIVDVCGPQARMIAVRHPESWAIPAFDLGDLPSLLGWESYIGAARHGYTMIQQRTLQTPFDECLWITSYITAWNGPLHPSGGTHVQNQDVWHMHKSGDRLLFRGFFRDFGWKRGQWSAWMALPCGPIIDLSEGSFAVGFYSDDVQLDDSDNAAMQEVINRLLAGAALFSRQRGEASPSTEFSRSVNAGRVRGGLHELPLVRTIDVNGARRAAPMIASTGTGAPKAPHMRRGHPRSLADGRVVYVRPCAVNGGGDRAPVYRLLIR